MIGNVLKDFIGKNPAKARMAAFALFACGIIVYLFLFLSPQVGRFFTTVIGINRISKEIKDAEAEIARIEGYKKELSSYKKRVGLYEKSLPMEQEIPSILESLSNMAGDSGVEIVAITPLPGVSKDSMRGKETVYYEVPIIINAKSGYHELGSFLSGLEGSDRLMKIKDIEIKSNKADSRRHNVELIISTYILAKEKAG